MNRQEPVAEVRCPECLGELPGDPGTAAALLRSGCVYCGTELSRGALPSTR